MKVLEERCGIITNMEVMLLLVQQQQLLPSVDSLLRCASKPSSTSSGNTPSTASLKSDLRGVSDRDDAAGGQSESAAERFRLDHVKELLYQHMFNQMVQDYIRKTCPYLHLVRVPPDLRHPQDRSRSQQAMRNPTRRSLGGAAGSRRASGIAAMRHGGVSPLISRRCRECIDALVRRFGLTELELLTILNLGAYKPVEIYMFLEDCSSRLACTTKYGCSSGPQAFLGGGPAASVVRPARSWRSGIAGGVFSGLLHNMHSLGTQKPQCPYTGSWHRQRS